MRLESVILLEQQSAAEVRAQAQAEARAAAAEARAQAQVDAQRVRDEAQQIREEAQRIREQVRQQIRIEQGQGFGEGRGQGQGGQPVIVVPPTPPWGVRNDIPPNVVDLLSILAIAAVICIVGFPIARAIGRWIDRRGLPGPVNNELAAQMTRIEQAVDTMSVEVERISEAQRFQAKLLSDREKVRA